MKLRLERKSARIELIPLIDIIFLLLVFFIYSMLSMVVYRGIPVMLPAAETIEAERGQPLVITINKQGKIFVDKELIVGDQVLSRLKMEQTAFPDKTAVISGHRESPYKVFVDVLDKARLAGFKKVSVEAQPKETGERNQ